jgi:transposase
MAEYLKYSVGIDVSKEKFDSCFSVIDPGQKVTVKSTRKMGNTPSGIQELINWSNAKRKLDIPLVFVMEATGVYYEKIALELYSQGFDVSVVLPNKSKSYMQSLGLKSKNDKIDAKGLARMGAEQHLDIWQPFSKNIYQLRMLTRQNEDLQKERTVILNRLEAQKYCQRESKFVVRQLKSMLRFIDKQIEQVNQEIEKCVERDQALSEKIKNIESIKGVGMLTIATLVAETNGFLLFRNQRQLVSYTGYDVVENQSGKRSGKTKISKKGNSHIRRALHMPAFNVVRYNQGGFKDLYERVFQRTGMKMRGYTAVQRKLLVLIYTLWKKGEAYDQWYYETSGNDEQKLLFSQKPERTKKIPDGSGTLDELLYKESQEALFSHG